MIDNITRTILPNARRAAQPRLLSPTRFRIEEVRDRIGGRLPSLARFRQRVYMPRWGLGWPLWVDARSVDVARHVGVFPVAAADEEEFLSACERLRRQPLDRSQPLWVMWFLPGLAQGRVGLFMKLHHALADGVAGVAAFWRVPRRHPRWARSVNVPMDARADPVER
jgi:hypothetical protein